MSLHCKVIFPKNPLNVFYTGQTVRGYVQLTVEEEQPVSAIRIEITGIAISKLKRNNVNKVHRVDCFNHRISILGNSYCGQPVDTLKIILHFIFALNFQLKNDGW